MTSSQERMELLAENTMITLGLLDDKLDLDSFIKNCDQLERAMIQKTAGQEGHRKKSDVDFANLFPIKAMIIVEACLIARELKKGETIKYDRNNK